MRAYISIILFSLCFSTMAHEKDPKNAWNLGTQPLTTSKF